ncbi:MAG: phenylalanine--tRNA ligase subunit beta, partial [Defluviitaleaceae bacterium]|nr:phenylalanine--tRNA ligase subunit beta [Defluviitaleaceae bacterium]
MNIPLSWLKAAAQIDDNTPTFLAKMTDAGNAVEGVEMLGEDITNVVVGKIISLEKHPDADKLWVTQTDIGTETLQIITGADNLKVGDYIPVAVHGATLANGLKIKKGKMRGLDSNGMLCSIDELGYTMADFPEAVAEGIYVFQPDVIAECIRTGSFATDLSVEDLLTLGSDARRVMQLREDVADFDILSNRPDTNSVMGMAREAAAVYGKTLELPPITLKEAGAGSAADLVTVDIQDPVRCPRYIARVVKNVKIGPSPQWLRRRLSTAGIRPINNIVDITNYVMLEYGQPLHAFDISAVAVENGKHAIVVRTAKAGETFTTLDGEERTLTDTTLLIADPQKPIGIAGVMGGENSKIEDGTTTILFESANFDSANIRQTSRALGMRTDASARYEKGQDPNQALTSVNRAMELVELLGCGDVVPGMVDAYPTKREERTIAFKPCAICALLGVSTGDLNPAVICEYLARVGIQTRDKGDHMEAIIPTFRADIAGEADLAEEVARFYGLNNIPSRTTQILSESLPENAAGKHPRRRRQDALKRTLTGLGYSEALTYPFESPKVFDKLNIPAGDGLRQVVALKNPLGEDFSILRTQPFGGLLESLARNYNKGSENVALFEIAHTYGYDEPPIAVAGGKLPPLQPSETSATPITTTGFTEAPYLALVSYGKDTDYLSLKGDIETLIATLT